MESEEGSLLWRDEPDRSAFAFNLIRWSYVSVQDLTDALLVALAMTGQRRAPAIEGDGLTVAHHFGNFPQAPGDGPVTGPVTFFVLPMQLEHACPLSWIVRVAQHMSVSKDRVGPVRRDNKLTGVRPRPTLAFARDTHITQKNSPGSR